MMNYLITRAFLSERNNLPLKAILLGCTYYPYVTDMNKKLLITGIFFAVAFYFCRSICIY